MNCITLNMCGLGEDHKVNWILRLKNRHKILFFGIQQTQMSNAEEINVAGCWGSNEFEHDGVNAVGRSGGLLSIWDKKLFSVFDIIKTRYFIIVSGNWSGISSPVNFDNIYGPHQVSDKAKLWDDLLTIKDNKARAWVFLGNFNAVRRPDERMYSQFCSITTAGFNNFIAEAGLIDLKMGGYKFTYSCTRELKLSKLDRFLCCLNKLHFPLLICDRFR